MTNSPGKPKMTEKPRHYRVAEAIIGDREKQLVNQALDTGWVSSAGPFVEQFERSFAAYCKAPFATAVSNGTVALHLALAAMGIKPGDEVIVPAVTFFATAEAVVYCGATPVIADIDPDHWCLTEKTIESVLSSRTRAIIPVHLFGQPAPMDQIKNIFPSLMIIEDAAEAHGATVGSRYAGTIGETGIFSFYGNKLLTTGEGGMILTSDPEIHQRMNQLRNHGSSPAKRYWHDYVGFNYRMTNLQAALGVAQLERLDEVIAHRRRLFDWYGEQLAGIEGISLQGSVPDTRSVYWMIAVCIDKWKSYDQRDAAAKELAEAGIETRPMFYPLNEMPACAEFPHAPDLNVSARIARSGIMLPSGPTLTENDVSYICEHFRRVIV